MKLILYFVTTVVFIINTGCAHSQSKDEQIMAILKEFYIEYNAVWENATSYKYEELMQKLFALQRKFCSERLQNEVKKYYEKGIDRDLITNDLGGTNSEKLKATLTIEKDKIKKDSYIVSYMFEFKPPDTPRDVKNVIHVTVIEEDGSYKIDEVW